MLGFSGSAMHCSGHMVQYFTVVGTVVKPLVADDLDENNNMHIYPAQSRCQKAYIIMRMRKPVFTR